tara:strand:- start:86 stop:265 length:180 start_codon:yes stop_codon:yes gene_type:complete
MKMIIAALLLLTLIGCDSSDVNGGFLKGNADVQLITLEDGTQCAVLIGHRRGALDCNWK